MEATQAPHTLKIRIGNAEFESMGPEEVVKEQFAQFLQLMERIPASAFAATPGHSNSSPRIDRVAGVTAGDSDGHDPLESMWERAYMRREDQISLHVLPTSKTPSSDAILLIVYGYQKWLGREFVRSIELMESALQSGLRIDRIDRNLSPAHRKLIIKGGSGKGSRYSLNNRGLKEAQELLEALFE